MNAQEELRDITMKAAALGKTLFESNGYNAFSWIAMILGTGPDENAVVMCPEGVPAGYFYKTICDICQQVPYDVKGICMIMDTYSLDSNDMTPEDAQKARQELHAGDLAKRFEECDPIVKEALSVAVLTHAGSQMVSVPYKYTPVDGWEWDEVTEVPADAYLDWELDRVLANLPRRTPEEIKEDLG